MKILLLVVCAAAVCNATPDGFRELLKNDFATDSNKGEIFALAFMSNGLTNPNADIFISTNDPGGAQVMISLPFLPDVAGFPRTVTVTRETNQLIEFPVGIDGDFDIRVDSTVETTKSILVTSTADVSIIGGNDQDVSTDGFLALPCKDFKPADQSTNLQDYRYFVFSANNDYAMFSSRILLVTCENGPDITVTLPGGENEVVPTLRQYEAYLIEQSEVDLTGTVIISDTPLAVFSGHECGQVPFAVTACDHLVEQIPPHATYGTMFFAVPFALRESGDIFRIGSLNNDNQVTVTCTRRTASGSISIDASSRTIGVGQFHEHRTLQNDGTTANYRRDFCCIETSRPAIVMQYSLGHTEDRVGENFGDPAITLVPPVTQYSNNYTVHTFDGILPPLSPERYRSYISWAVSAEFFSPDIVGDDQNLMVNGAPFSPPPLPEGSGGYVPIQCSGGRICGYGAFGQIATAIDSTITYESQREANPGIYVSIYGFVRENSYAYPAGYQCEPIGLPHITVYDRVVNEGVGTVVVQFNRTGGDLSEGSRIFASTRDSLDGKALAGPDYVAIERQRIRWSSTTVEPRTEANNDRPFEITIVDDDVQEDIEYLEVFFIVDTIGFGSPDAVARITILDNDGVTIGFINAPYFVSENGSFVDVTVGVLSGGLQTQVSVEISFSDGSAVNGSDYLAQGEVLIFSSSNLLSAVRVTPLDDNEIELNETLSASLSFVGAEAVSLDPASAEIIIIDNELSEIDPLESTDSVTCYPADNCTGIESEESTTLGKCCSNLLAPEGFSYSLLDQNQTVCTPCPIVLGFANASFAGEERAENYSVDAGYLSGRPSVEGTFTIGLTLETASEGDIHADSTIQLSPNCLLSAVSLSLRVDRIAQESNEIFSLFFRDPPLSNSSLSSLVSIRPLSGEIIDSDEITFALSEEVCEGTEGEGALSVTIIKIAAQDVMLANPVSFKITPLTFCEASGRMFISTFVPDNSLSPNRADELDFDANAITVEFPPGVASVAANISIRDDEVNEAMNQTFIVYLEVEDAVKENLITLSRRDTTCTIVDNDDIQIGFARASYSFLEPSTSLRLITNVELVRDEGRQSEQTFQVQVSVGPPSSGANAATLRSTTMGNDYDYSPVSLVLELPPSAETVPFSFIVNVDFMSEGQEAFQANLSAVEGFSGGTFQPATTNSTFQSTEIHILDYSVDMPDTRVICYMTTTCSGDFFITTGPSCCNNLEEPLGFSYQSADYMCEECPTVFGFSPENFTEMEQNQHYTVRVGYLSGRPLGNPEFNFIVEFINDTAGEDDVQILTDQVDIQPPQLLVLEVMFVLIADKISQEGNETFSIELKPKISSGALRLTAQIIVTIIDGDGVAIDLSPEFRKPEAPNAMMTISISKNVTLANPIFFRVIPLTADEAERRGVVAVPFNCPPDNDFSPCRADETDFDGTALNVTFPADEDLEMELLFVDTFINIFDDEVDETQEQRFVAYLEILDAVDLSLVEIGNDTAICIIEDNDDTRIGFTEQAYMFNEPDAEIRIREVMLIREGGTLSEQTFGVNISVINPTGRRPATLESDDLNNSDYRINSTDNFLHLQFPAEVKNITFEFFLKSDELPEGVEAFQATATPLEGFPTFLPPLGEGTGLAFASTEILISDANDRVVLGFVSSEDIVLSETQSGGVVELKFGVLEGYLSFIVLMNAEFSIAGGEHYFTTNFTLIGNETRTINVSLMEEFEDREVDSTLNETYSGQVTTRAPYPNIVLVNNTVVIVIVDDDVQIGFMNNGTMVSEGEMQVKLVVQVLAGHVPEGVVVNVSFQTIPGSATAGRDYTTTSGNLTFAGNQSHHNISISLVEDGEVEGDEEFFVMLSIPDFDQKVQLKNPNFTITIMDSSNEAGGSSGIDITIPTVSAIAFALILLIFILAAIIICAQRKKSKKMAINEIELDKYESSMRVRKTYRVNVPKNLIINSCNLQLNDPVGQGEFGIVYKARLSKGFNKSFSEVVAVKTLKGFLEQSVVKDLLKECSKMSTLDHPNVLTLIGVCMDGGPAPYIVMPFMFNGSLLAHLKKERENLVILPNQQEERDTTETSAKLLDMSLQVAKGMEYLASKKLIHRDLAARNCMIDMNFVIKVADFGLSESTGNYKDYFRQEKSEQVKLPVKWLAPECLSDGVFSEKSDVWAFGVTCWEICSGGKVPYAGINPMELPRMLENGYRMEMPSNSACTDAMSKMMTQCWAAAAKDRPTFSGIVISFSENLELISGYMGICEEKNDS